VEVEEQVAAKRRELVAEEGRLASISNTEPSSLNEISFDLHCNEVRQRTAEALRRIISRIDVSYSYSDLPLDEDTKAAFLAKLFNADEQWPFIVDPVPNDKRRKEVFILITFISGAQRSVVRLEFHRSKNVLVTCKINADEDHNLIVPTAPTKTAKSRTPVSTLASPA
jgi:hypothetical protein